MNIASKTWFIFIISALYLHAAIAGAETEAGFTSLFNGKNLDGWEIEHGNSKTFQVKNGVIYCPGSSNFPAWLRSEETYENFDLRFEFRMDGWCNSGMFFHAPLHGRNSRVGFEFQIDHKRKEPISIKTCGAIFDVLPPKTNAVGPNKSWNQARILMDWPSLKCWLNGELIQDINVEEHEELKYRLRSGYLGLQDCGYRGWYRHIRIKHLPGKEHWTTLFNGRNLDGWYVEGSGAKWRVRRGVIRAWDGTSYLVTKSEYRNFELHTYVRTAEHANGGIFVRWNTLKGGDRGNEIQIENIPDSNYPTGSLYNYVRADQPRYRDGEWFPMQIRLNESHLVVRVNGETVVDTHEFPTIREGKISLQMHKNNSWIEFKDIKIKKLSE
ncbi:DUF1080 domain-containing protein [bacterium]|nr:DUF1080 domain-containing protein [bacterium]